MIFRDNPSFKPTPVPRPRIPRRGRAALQLSKAKSVLTPSAHAPSAVPTSADPMSEIPPSALEFAHRILQFPLDPTQSQILAADPHRVLICCTRQWGKSTTAAIKALHHALTNPGSLTLIASRTRTQATELLHKVTLFARSVGVPTPRAPGHPTSLLLPSSARIIALPGDPASIRGLSAASLLIVDEAAFVPDDLYHALRPILATTNGAIWLLSTPNGPRGFFHEEYVSTGDWTRFQVTALDCPRISPEFLEEEKRKLGPALFEQEYLCKFSAQAGSFFDLACFHDTPPPGPEYIDRSEEPRYFVGFDLGQRDSHSAAVVLELLVVNTHRRDPVTYDFIVRHELHVRSVERFPLNMTYSDTARRLKAIIAGLPSRAYAHLAMDVTGCGAPFFEVLNRMGAIGVGVDKVALTSGGRVSFSNGFHLIPKKAIIHVLNEIVTNGRFHIPLNLANRKLLLDEMESFRARPTRSGSTRYNSAQTDDLVMALAFAAWKARKYLPLD
ncbi:MAG: terminase family protein [Bryobacteraceae bacterium]